MYEFAGRIVGKCLYESALGGAYKQLVRARFTRSFLAQIIGLRMNYKVWNTVLVMFWLFAFCCQLLCLIKLTSLTERKQETWCVSWHYLFHREQASMFRCLFNFLRFQSWELKQTQSSFCPSTQKMKCHVYLKTAFSCYFHFVFLTQYFETDDQEFYKTKVCFILNNDVSEMDLVFAEEKYSKSGQLEKVRQRFGKDLFYFLM